MEALENIVEQVVHIAVPVFELIGILVVAYTILSSFITYVRCIIKKKPCNVEHSLAQGHSLALEFLIASEILKTITLHETEELMILVIVIVMRVVLSILIHFEMKQSNKTRAEEK